MAEAREQGRQQARAELAAAIEDQRRSAADMAAASAALSSALDQLQHADLSRVQDVEQHVLNLAVALAEEIVGREVRTDDGLVMAAAQRALALAPDRSALVLRVSPADAAVVREGLSEISAHLSNAVQVIADPSIERAGAVAEAGPLRIDAQISSTLARIREAFAQ
ncbi:MAG: Flagellar assembly protein FliH/Type secretion system HrpE [Ilumatobacteraceae bacterium]|nr:Flagellar assembly protein FliH/Type secretion system HrpE [Ilumatobacteraceae bacterium]